MPQDLEARIRDLAEQAYNNNKAMATGFLDPAAQDEAEAVARSIRGIVYRFFGGYPGAERQRLVVYPDYLSADSFDEPIGAVEITGKWDGTLTHRDFLGSLTALGLKIDRLGDLLPGHNKCHVLVVPEVADFITLNLTRVGSFPVEVVRIDPDMLDVGTQKLKEIRGTVASLRLDAVASTGFGVSRSKMAKEIKSERVKVNWQVEDDPAQSIKEKDVISYRGKGRVVVEEIGGTSRKGRVHLRLMRTRS
ncbi:MAG: YlmH/Sll1252 family protein [Limnochordia bacterium]|nr:YlmH/Sll1252 family protein [Limnochordia bacterium]